MTEGALVLAVFVALGAALTWNVVRGARRLAAAHARRRPCPCCGFTPFVVSAGLGLIDLKTCRCVPWCLECFRCDAHCACVTPRATWFSAIRNMGPVA